MSQLVRYGEQVVRRIRMVKQYVRMRTVCTPAVRAVALVFRLKDVHPALVLCPQQKLAVFLAQRSKSLDDDFKRLLKFIGAFRVFDYRHIHIVHVKLFAAQSVLS